MSLDEELRTTFEREAALRTPPPPDVVGLVHRGRARRRRRTLRRAAIAVAGSMVVGVTAAGVLDLDPRAADEIASTPSPSPRATLETMSDDGRSTLEPGTYEMFVGHDPAGESISAAVTVDGPHWKHGDFPVVTDEYGATYAGFGVYQPRALAAGNGCETDPTLPALTRTPAGLAAQLAELPRSTVLHEPKPVRMLGLDAVHLRLRIDVECPGYYRVAHASGGTRGISYTLFGRPHPDVLIDFWVLDVDGAVVIVDEWHNADAPADLVRQARDARRSITFVAGG